MYGSQNYGSSENHNGFFFNPKTATNRRISTRAGSTLKDREIEEPLKQNYQIPFNTKEPTGQECNRLYTLYMHVQKHKPAKGKNNPIRPALPLLKHKERQGYGCSAVDSQSWEHFLSGKNVFEATDITAHVPTCRLQGSTSRWYNPTAQIERKVEPLKHWHGLLWLWWDEHIVKLWKYIGNQDQFFKI